MICRFHRGHDALQSPSFRTALEGRLSLRDLQWHGFPALPPALSGVARRNSDLLRSAVAPSGRARQE